MDHMKKNRQIANRLYDLGLEKAKIRDLTGAAEYLKKSLRFDKYQTDARNLLGLIFYETGETAEALVQWVISMNLKPQDNLAGGYVEELRRRSGELERSGLALQAYNQALWQAKNDNSELAALQLAKAVEESPRFVKGHMLLALIYMSRSDYVKAGQSLMRVLRIDRYDPKAQWYMSIVKQNTGREDVERKKMKNAFSHRKMQDDDLIVPPEYKENTGWSSILNIIAGLAIGMLSIYFLVMPANTKSLNTAHNQELLDYSRKLSEVNQQLDAKTEEYDDLKVHADDMEARLASIDEDNQAVLRQYQAVITILQAYRDEDLPAAAQAYAALDPSLIQEESVTAIVNKITQEMTTEGYQTLEDLGTASWNAGKKEEAAAYYEKSLQVKPDNTSAMYLLGRIYQELGNTDLADQWFGKIITEYPESEQAEQARTARGS
ncbi:MAG: tetratricopeptide repeat protein [Lachnospiraceae bacterium]|nr:tetratricopeptide repeat protein [Lachnospiraceae bacterium]